MRQELKGGVVFTTSQIERGEYLPNKGVFLGGMLGRSHGHDFGFYHGKIEPGSGIATEIHPDTSETIYVIVGEAVGFIGEQEFPLSAGQVMHVEKNVHHGIRNAGEGTLEILVIGHPDFEY